MPFHTLTSVSSSKMAASPQSMRLRYGAIAYCLSCLLGPILSLLAAIFVVVVQAE